ncbi:exosome complex component MTR3-like [Saccoglossus kowalevskii]|uniref:Exosome complex component MTR3-like n=1 Tax=Saccoglossus kowalevskii TaxID=10224 RepID=A0ABM0GWA0_SACKO|nr:PREDICTED: exosome complex component MTR3-like [Saccoglossus kowalevskii]
MPLDSKRIPGPRESFPVTNFISTEKDNPDLVNDDGTRHDGRKPNDIRPIFLRCGIISNAKGSAYIETKDTKVTCAVYGPRQVVRREDFKLTGTLTCDFKFATFSCQKRQQHMQSSNEKDLSLIVLQAMEPAVCLEKYPRAQIDIFITVLQNGGSALSAAITCASAALAAAGIEMYDVVVGCSTRQIGNTCLVDPAYDEEYNSKTGGKNNGSLCLGLMPSLNQVSAFIECGELETEILMQSIHSCVDGCMRIYPVVRQCLTKSIKSLQKHQDGT